MAWFEWRGMKPTGNSLYYVVKALPMLVLYGKYGIQRMISRRNIVLSFALCYICLLPTLFVPYFSYGTRGNALTHIYMCVCVCVCAGVCVQVCVHMYVHIWLMEMISGILLTELVYKAMHNN